MHAGSLVAAVASWLSVRVHGGHWALRIDDLDQARCPPGAADLILRQLEAHGLYWDGAPRYQSAHVDEYAAARAQLEHAGVLYRCNCTRATLRTRLSTQTREAYDGHCRHHRPANDARVAWRYTLAWPLPDLPDAEGRPVPADPRRVGDPVVWRVDGIPGYSLACAVDEASMQISEVVRGIDLLGEGYAQHQLLTCLGHAPPHYRHVAVKLDARGHKLSKQNHAPALDTLAATCSTQLADALEWLGHPPPAALRKAPVATLLDHTLHRLRGS